MSWSLKGHFLMTRWRGCLLHEFWSMVLMWRHAWRFLPSMTRCHSVLVEQFLACFEDNICQKAEVTFAENIKSSIWIEITNISSNFRAIEHVFDASRQCQRRGEQRGQRLWRRYSMRSQRYLPGNCQRQTMAVMTRLRFDGFSCWLCLLEWIVVECDRMSSFDDVATGAVEVWRMCRRAPDLALLIKWLIKRRMPSFKTKGDALRVLQSKPSRAFMLRGDLTA